MSLNINTVLNNIASTYRADKKNQSATNKNDTASNNIFAQQATELVAKYKAKQEETSGESSGKTNIFGMSFTQIANMSTKDFLNYAYDNEASSGFNEQSADDSGVKLPALVRYKTKVVATGGKSFMAVVAKFKGMFPTHTEEQIAAELLKNYSGESTTGKSLNMSA